MKNGVYFNLSNGRIVILHKVEFYHRGYSTPPFAIAGVWEQSDGMWTRVLIDQNHIPKMFYLGPFKKGDLP